MAHYKYTTEGMEVWRNRKDTRHRKQTARWQTKSYLISNHIKGK